MKIIDVTRVLSPGMAQYPLNPPYERELFRDLPEATSALSRLSLGTHSGTHVDAPRHVLKPGDGIDRVPLDRLIASAVLLDLTAVADTISATHLQRQEIPRDRAVLLKTRNSAADEKTFDERFIACDESAAEFLVERRAKAVGVDGPSIKKYQVKDRTHLILLERGIPVVEHLDFSRAAPGHYTFVCLPLKLEGADGAPARAVLLGAPPR